MNVFARLFADSKPLVHVLVCVFAISSWVDINGMWVELPIFVTHLPEKWTLPSYITILGQIANIGPIIFSILAYLLAKKAATSTSSSSSAAPTASKLTLDKVTSYAIMLVGVTATLLLAFLWQRTHWLLGAERSVALLALSFFLSIMDCTSSVAYVAFMSALKPAYLPSFFVGEGLSGLLPALMALGQGAGDVVCKNGSSTQEKNESGIIVNVTTYFEYPMYLPPRFSVQLFFFLLSGMIAISFVAFCLLNNLRYCKDEFVSHSVYDLSISVHSEKRRNKSGEPVGIINPACSVKSVMGGDDAGRTNDADERGGCPEGGQFSGIRDTRSSSYGSYGSLDRADGCAGGGEEEPVVAEDEEMSVCTVLLLLGQVIVINFLITSFLLSIQTYSSLPYGISIYNLVVTLTNIANPVACLISMFLAIKSLLAIASLTVLGAACGAYIIVAAAMSPDPPLVGHSSGGAVAMPDQRYDPM
ncbi:solute carrier family 52, riboflavin transporter, member 3-B-like isoform X2 [Babylonia areolata]|uniref:solute carrier family 52, riboflavin transporter, member 3-B-like isoform X2 n=1 Tax=Babylonia areolata TaxID=304850 RepID=UPI003FCEF84C